MKFTDSHCHLDFDAFSINRQAVLNQCVQQNIHQLIIPAISPDNWPDVLKLAKQPPQQDCKIFPCLGIHPWFLKDLTEEHLTQLTHLVEVNKADLIAIGEAGIDGVISKEQDNLAQQISFFDYQLALAKQSQLPILVHHRRSHAEVISRIKAAQLNEGGIIHAFSGSYQQACQYIDLGFKLGIGGTITYPRAEKTIKAIKRLPSSCLVLETDAPAMPLYGYQGEANSPIRIIEVFNRLVEIRSEPAEQLANTIEQNLRSLFKQL